MQISEEVGYYYREQRERSWSEYTSSLVVRLII
jgi:hypothetical protein